MSTDRDRPWTVADVVRGLDEQGWLPKSKTPEAAVRTALERMTRAGEVEKTRVDGGVAYRLVFNVDEAIAAKGGA